MKLAEALLLRADLMKKLASLRERVVQNAVIQEGDEPHEDPQKLLGEAIGVLDQLEDLIARVQETNGKAKLADGRTLARAIARRNALEQQHALLVAALAGTKKEPDRYGVREIKWVATLKVPKLQKQADDLSKKLRELNAEIQETNWKVKLVD
ncbi:MAG: DIP1984 family protein [Sandaracinaceae bacterium]